jgi:hypothetical protein
MAKKIDSVKLILAALGIMVTGFIIHSIGSFLTYGYYADVNYIRVWSKLMMPTMGPPPKEFYYYSLFFGFITAFIYAYVYSVLEKALPGRVMFEKGLWYGWFLFLVNTIPATLSLYLLINLPTALIFEWAIEGLLLSLISGIIIARVLM